MKKIVKFLGAALLAAFVLTSCGEKPNGSSIPTAPAAPALNAVDSAKVIAALPATEVGADELADFFADEEIENAAKLETIIGATMGTVLSDESLAAILGPIFGADDDDDDGDIPYLNARDVDPDGGFDIEAFIDSIEDATVKTFAKKIIDTYKDLEEQGKNGNVVKSKLNENLAKTPVMPGVNIAVPTFMEDIYLVYNEEEKTQEGYVVAGVEVIADADLTKIKIGEDETPVSDNIKGASVGAGVSFRISDVYVKESRDEEIFKGTASGSAKVAFGVSFVVPKDLMETTNDLGLKIALEANVTATFPLGAIYEFDMDASDEEVMEEVIDFVSNNVKSTLSIKVLDGKTGDLVYTVADCKTTEDLITFGTEIGELIEGIFRQ